MQDITVRLDQARRQALQAQARVAQQKALVDALAREGRDAARAQRVLREMTLLADLLRDHATHLEAQSCHGLLPASAPGWIGDEDPLAEPEGWNPAAGANRAASRLTPRIG